MRREAENHVDCFGLGIVLAVVTAGAADSELVTVTVTVLECSDGCQNNAVPAYCQIFHQSRNSFDNEIFKASRTMRSMGASINLKSVCVRLLVIDLPGPYFRKALRSMCYNYKTAGPGGGAPPNDKTARRPRGGAPEPGPQSPGDPKIPSPAGRPAVKIFFVVSADRI
jgi:hypothetical protein